MRTTLTLDDDVVKALERLRQEQGVGLSEAANTLIRRGLAAADAPAARFVQTTSSLGAARVPLDDVAGALELLEGEAQAR